MAARRQSAAPAAAPTDQEDAPVVEELVVEEPVAVADEPVVAETHPTAAETAVPSDPEEIAVDYVGFAAELNAIAEAAAGVKPGDSDAVRQEKLHEWNAAGGLLKAVEAGKFDVPSETRGGKLSDTFQHDALVPNVLVLLEAGAVETVAEFAEANDLNLGDVVPVPNRQPWEDGVTATVNDFTVRWDGESWVSGS